jgi:hypothetical protein
MQFYFFKRSLFLCMNLFRFSLGTKWDKMTRGRNDQGTKWPGDKMTGDELTGDEMYQGTKWPGRNDRGRNERGRSVMPPQVRVIVSSNGPLKWLLDTKRRSVWGGKTRCRKGPDGLLVDPLRRIFSSIEFHFRLELGSALQGSIKKSVRRGRGYRQQTRRLLLAADSQIS